jgi:RNA polymerase sigma factor (sigma-70 family)
LAPRASAEALPGVPRTGRFARGRFARRGVLARPSVDELDVVYRENVGPVYGFFSYSVGRETAEDLTAATFERVVRSWDRFDASRAGERTWIFAIARNLLTDYLRAQRHRSGPSLDAHPAILDSVGASEDPLAQTMDLEAIAGWLSQLRPREREVLALRYCADLSVAEIAACLKLSEANVHQISSRALRRLRSTGKPEQSETGSERRQ